MLKEIADLEQQRIKAEEQEKKLRTEAESTLKNFLLSQVAALIIDEFNEGDYQFKADNPLFPGFNKGGEVILRHSKVRDAIIFRFAYGNCDGSSHPTLSEEELSRRIRANGQKNCVKVEDFITVKFAKDGGYEFCIRKPELYVHERSKDPVDIAIYFAKNYLHQYFEPRGD